jgi:CRISPR-associated endonuclease Csn1
MSEILGIDLGTNSIGLTKRNTELGKNVIDQLEYFSSIVFQKGVGTGKTGEFSFAAKRTKHRSARRLYQARKYRIWETLDVLRRFGFCPISENELDQWRKYDKSKGLKRKYPVEAIQFERWIRLDFDGDGISDYSSPYQLRAELATKQFDFANQIDKYKLGRALYHISQRRGFKSSKGETIKEQEKEAESFETGTNVVEIQIDLKKSEEKKSKDLLDYMKKHNLPTVGCCFYQLQEEGIRVSASNFQAVRSNYVEEIKFIFNFQNELDIDSDFFRIINKAIFYKRPLRSQKGLVGKCTLETAKARCPLSHPEFETFRAWSFINNILFRKTPNDEWKNLSIDLKEQLFDDKFLRTKSNFKFEEIREWIERKVGFNLYAKSKTINYKDKTNVAGCPISARLKNLLGNDWKNFQKETNKTRINKKTGEIHKISYSMEDIWHICFSFEDEERIVDFAKNSLEFDEKQTKTLINLWAAIPQGYSMLSLKAIKNINEFLKEGLIYTDAVLLAKLPDILGKELWDKNKEFFLSKISKITEQNRKEKRILNIVNNLVANYKSLELNEQFAYKKTDYTLDHTDHKDIEMAAIENFGEKSWEKMPQDEKKEVIAEVTVKYQEFFSSSIRDFYKLPKLGESLKYFLAYKTEFEFLKCKNNFIDPSTDLPCKCSACKKLNLIYHPSQIEFYKPAKPQNIDWKGKLLSLKLLESPKIGSFKNPMAMRTLHELRKAINYLLKEGIISEETRVIIETAKDLNDSNMRWAIETYQREREKENKIFEDAIKELYGNSDKIVTTDEIDKVRIFMEQYEIPDQGKEKDLVQITEQKKKSKERGVIYNKDITKYRLWLEQGCRCIYTGKMISISDLFSENKIDFEHTIPRSISFDNSLANLTVCDAYFNRNIKRNQIPSQLSNYKDILRRLEPWEEKIERLSDNVNYWKLKSKQAQIKESKDDAIRQKHLWQMELDYWKNKLDRFKMEEVTSGFRNSQLVDTRIITKYATHYLKSVFNHVDVQKGTVNATFRKILGVQSVDEKKSRDKHSHHAIDAAILTLIPSAGKRDRMLKLYYEIEEKKRAENVDQLKIELDKERRSCNLGNVSGISKFIEEKILINHVSKDQSFTPAHKKGRKRGKEVLIKDSQGNLKTKWITGESIRGQLHLDTFFGKIKKVKRDKTGKPLKNEKGDWIYDEKNEGFRFVLRKPINSIDKLDQIVDPDLIKIIEKQLNGRNLKTAISEGIYMYNRNGNITGSKIRHI